jgi:hypothetical protein
MQRLLNLAIFSLSTAAACFAAASPLEVEGMAKLGMLTGSYSGRDATGKFDSQGAIEIEGNLFRSPGMAYAVRSSIALDITTSRTRYFYAGLGQRFFFGPHGFESFTQEGGDSIRIHPKLRYALGYDLGLSQVLVIPYGTILGAYATTADTNLSAEARYSVDRNMSISGTLGMGVGTGIATMNVTTTTMRALVGFVYGF